MKMMKKAARGFTLIELMIVVAIIGILAAIAIPNFMKYQLRTKRSEGSINVAGIRTAQMSYHASKDIFVGAAPAPVTVDKLSSQKNTWVTNDDFDKLDWRPEGGVYFTYGVEVNEAGNAFTVEAAGDVDGDTELSCWTFAKLSPAGAAETGTLCATEEFILVDAGDDKANVERVALVSADNVY